LHSDITAKIVFVCEWMNADLIFSESTAS